MCGTLRWKHRWPSRAFPQRVHVAVAADGDYTTVCWQRLLLGPDPLLSSSASDAPLPLKCVPNNIKRDITAVTAAAACGNVCVKLREPQYNPAVRKGCLEARMHRCRSVHRPRAARPLRREVHTHSCKTYVVPSKHRCVTLQPFFLSTHIAANVHPLYKEATR